MASPYTFDVTLRPWGDGPNRGVVKIDTAARYGSWEHKDGTEGGGLWFDEVPGLYREGQTPSLELVDFDGYYMLPRSVVDALRTAGYILDETFNP
jgi:hypothetical protein